MEKNKKLKLSLISLVLAFLLAVAAAVLLLTGKTYAVYAADRFVELDGNSVFYTSIRGAEITQSEEKTEGSDAHRYTLFKIGEGQTVSYRQNLAYSWISGGKDGEGKFDGTHTDVQHFSMEISFEELNFKRFVIKLQSQQYEMTKEQITENYLVFTPVNDEVRVSVLQTLEDDADKADEQVVATTYAKGAKIKIAFGDYDRGNYNLVINGAAAKTSEGASVAVKNVFETYATYVSSGDTAVTPLTFSAEFEEGQTGNTAQMLLYDINGQSFEMYLQSNGRYSVKDTASPVLCFGKTPSYLEYGKSIGLQYRAIDVLASSPRTTAYYYVLSGKQYASDTFDYDRIDYSNAQEVDGVKEESPFIQVNSSSSTRIIRDAETFIPADLVDSGNVYGLVKLYFELADVSGSSGNKDTVFADWYAKESALVNIYDLKQQPSNVSNFLKLIDGKEGVTYADSPEATLEDYKNSVQDFVDYYKPLVEDAIAKTEDGKLYAGGEKFYLPAIEHDFGDEYFTDRDLKYSVYYRSKTTGSSTSLDANKLAIDLNDADVTYEFTIYVTDSFGTSMKYPSGELDENGEMIWETIPASEVWDEKYAELLPFFSFDVYYKAATAEKPEKLSQAYVGTSYSGMSFKIKGISSTYTSNYNLYVFDRNAFLDEVGENLDYAAFTANTDKLLANTYKEGVNTRKFFTTVKASSQLVEGDNNYEEFKKLNWNNTSVSFTPQSVDDFYVVELTLTDNRSQLSTTDYVAVAASVQTTALKGESDWLENNLTSVILFAVAGVCLIALIILLIVKPKDKGDIDVIYSNEVETDKKPQGKKTKKSNK